MEAGTHQWAWRGETIAVGFEGAGQGPTVLLLPALSSISTRSEMRPLRERLSGRYRTTAVDWPGFGDRARPRLDWRPEAYSEFLRFVLATMTPAPHAVVAAGHGATYALAHACAHPEAFGRLVLVAPTWRGPLPTMMNGPRPFFERICRLVDMPVLMIYGAQTPSRSRAEMEALAAVPGVQSVRLPQGKLGLHEEFPDAVVDVIAPFLGER